MTKYIITVNGINSTVKSEAAMWNFLRSVRDNLTTQPVDGTVKVTTEDGTLFKDIEFRTVKGKIQMVNHVKETCRYAKVKAAKIAAAAKAQARKEAKRAADRRYRAKKHAAKIAAMEAAKAENPTA